MKTFVWRLYIWFDKLLTQASESYQVCLIWNMIHGCKVANYKLKHLYIIEWQFGLDHDSNAS
jgi:hypothetical protein